MKILLALLMLSACAFMPVNSFGQTNTGCGSCPVITNAFFYGTNGDSTGDCNFDIPNGPSVCALTAARDPGNNWNSTGNYWTIPVSGTYQIVTKLRLADGSDTGAGFGQGPDTTPEDSLNFLWSTVISSESGVVQRAASANTTVEHFDEGQQVSLIVWADDNGNDLCVDGASMTINLLFTDQ